jgi:hypothetical protein
MTKLLRPGTGALRRQIEPEWIELKAGGSDGKMRAENLHEQRAAAQAK